VPAAGGLRCGRGCRLALGERPSFADLPAAPQQVEAVEAITVGGVGRRPQEQDEKRAATTIAAAGTDRQPAQCPGRKLCVAGTRDGPIPP